MGPSITAQRVAAYRLAFERLESTSPLADPRADERLSADVAKGVTVDHTSPMARYLRGRTAFFDRVVINALGRDVTQIVVIGAGYDARALRYRTAAARWWEVDRGATQEDKRARLSRLGIACDDVVYVGLDLSEGNLADGLLQSGFQPDGPALFVAEGVAPYLEAETFGLVLREVRSLATPGTRFAMSLGRPSADPRARARFKASVAGFGEPAIGGLTSDNVEGLLSGCRWQRVPLKERSAASGFVMAAPVFAPPDPGVHPTLGRIGRFVEDMLGRRGSETLASHLQDAYGVPVVRSKELDLGVHRVERADSTTLVARVFPAGRSRGAVRCDAEILDWLARSGIPAERTATSDPVSVHEGQPVLITEFAAGRHPAAEPALFERLGALLAQLHNLPADAPPAHRPGGAWHHLLSDGDVYDEVAAAKDLLHSARHRVARGHEADYAQLSEALGNVTFPHDLPLGFVHADLVPRNVIQSPEGGITVVDWSGAGVGPRVVSLGCLLWSAGGHGPSLDAAIRGYRSMGDLTVAEIGHLPAAMAVRPAVLACWAFSTGRSSEGDAAAGWAVQERQLAKAAAHLRRRGV